MSETEVIEHHFGGRPSKKVVFLLDRLRKLGTRSDDRRKTDEIVSDEILATVVKVAEHGFGLVAPLLFSLSQERKPLLGSVFDRFDLGAVEKAQVLAQFVTDASDDRYPMLDLSRQGLRSVPKEIALVHVPPANIGSEHDPLHYRELNLGYNPITKLKGKDFEVINRFEAVHLIGLKIKELPASVRRLTNAIMINISWTDIAELPEELYELTRLRAIKLNWTPVAGISPRIRELEELCFIEVCETPFLRTIYSIQDADGAVTTEAQRRVQVIRDILQDLRCEICE